eukprot:SAG31_NODE_256_length_19032_cov_5.305181_7_plen_1244_part_00
MKVAHRKPGQCLSLGFCLVLFIYFVASGLSLIEFGRAVRTDGNVDRCKLSKKELDEIFHHIDENGDGRVSFKEFEDFLLLPRWHPSGGSLSRRARAAARRSKVSLDRQLEALNAHIDGLQEQKQNALLAEDYELAARLRDEIDRMRVSVLDVEPKSGNTLNVLVGNGRMPSDPLQRHSQETSTGANQWPVAYAANTTQQLLLDDGPDPPKNMPVPAALTIVHCAKWVAQHGAEFEETLKRKHLGATGWGFLYEGKTRRAQFYRDRLEYEIKLLKRARHREKKKERLRRRRNDPNKFPISDSGADNGYIVVTCPKDVLPGQSFFVQIPSGEQIRVEVPVGITFGDRFQVETRGGSDCAHDTGPGQITDSLKPDISADFTLRPQQNSKRRSVSPRQESGDNKNLDVSDRAQRSFPAGYYQVLRKSVLRADFERPSEVIHILRAGERVYVTKGAKDKDGLVWAMTRNGWVVPRRDGRRVLQLMELRQVKEKRSKQSKFKKDPRKQTLGTATEGASSLQEAAPVPAEAALVPASEAKTRGEDFPNGQAAGAAKKQPVSLRTQQAPAALDTIVGVPGTSGRGLTRRYSIALTPGTIDSFVQQVDISVKHGTGNDHEEETLEIMCPEGVCPGDTLFVTCPDGDEVEIVVPDGVSPGDAFDVSLQRETQDEGGARSASIPFLKDSVEDEDKAIWANTLQDEFMDEECTELGSASTALKSIEDALDPSCHNMTTIDLSLSRAEKVKLKHPAVTALRQKRAQLLEDEHRNPNVPAVPRSELISLDSGATEMSHSEAATRLDFRQRELLSNMQQADKVMREKELQIRQQQESIEAKKQEIMAIERATEAHTKVQSGDQHKPPREAVRTPTARPHAKPGAELEKKKFMLMVVPSALVKFSQKVVAEVGTLPQLEIELIDALKLAPGSSISICTGANFEPAQILGDIPSKGKIKVKEKIGLNSTSTIDEGDEEEEFSEEEDQVQIQPLQRQTDAVAGQTLRRGPSRRYSVSLEQGSLDSFVQQIDVPAAPPDNGASNDQDDDDLETLEIVCPDGVGPGDTLYVTCPDGDEVEILVPDGVSAGDVFDVSLRRNSNDAGGQDGHDEQMDAFEMLQSTLGALEDHSGSRLKDDEQKDDESDTQEDQVQIQPLQRQTDAVAGQTLRRGPSRRYSVSLEQGSLDSFVQQIDVPAAPPDNGASNDQDDDDLETLEIVCPDGVGPGDTLYVTCPDGDEVEILVPDGVSAGDVFDVSLQSLAA